MKSGRWSQDELVFLKDNYKDMSDEEIGKKLNRKKNSVKSKRQREGLRKDDYFWSDEEEEFIKENWQNMSDKELADELDRSKSSVANRRNKQLGINRPESHKAKFNKGIQWTEDKEKYLKENYASTDTGKLADELDTTKIGVKTKARRLGVSKSNKHDFSGHELELIERLNRRENSWTTEDIADYLGLNYDQVSNAIKRYDLSQYSCRQFEEEELEFIRENYQDLTNEELGEELERNTAVVGAKKNELGIFETPYYSDEEEEFIRGNWRDLSDSEMADELGRGLIGVKKKRRKMGLKFDSFVGTEKHFDWERLCVDVAECFFERVVYHKVFEGEFVPDIFVPEKNLVIDAKWSVYEGAVEDVQKYLEIDGVETVVIWSFKNFLGGVNDVKILDRSNLVEKLDDEALKDRISSLHSESNRYEKSVKQMKLSV